MQHTSVHPQVMRHALPAYALLMGLIIVHCWGVLRQRGALNRIAAMALLTGLIYPQLEGTICGVRMRIDEDFVDARGRTDVGPQEGLVYASLNDIVPQGGVILTNLNRTMPMRYWSRRPTYETQYLRSRKSGGQPARSALELSLNHLRELYHDRLPQL